jgi:hypothetical protein
LELEVLSSVPNHDIESILSDLGVHYDTRGSKQNFKKIRGITAIDDGDHRISHLVHFILNLVHIGYQNRM